MKNVIRVGKKGIVVLPKALREEVGIEEGSLLTAEAKGGSLVLTPLRVKIVDVDPEAVTELVRRVKLEERVLEERKLAERFGIELCP